MHCKARVTCDIIELLLTLHGIIGMPIFQNYVFLCFLQVMTTRMRIFAFLQFLKSQVFQNPGNRMKFIACISNLP
jgi:hypothetical protein